MEEVFLYLEVFSVCRFCCTAIWIEKYVHDVFKAVMRHLECPCFATLDSKVRKNIFNLFVHTNKIKIVFFVFCLFFLVVVGQPCSFQTGFSNFGDFFAKMQANLPDGKRTRVGCTETSLLGRRDRHFGTFTGGGMICKNKVFVFLVFNLFFFRHVRQVLRIKHQKWMERAAFIRKLF